MDQLQTFWCFVSTSIIMNGCRSITSAKKKQSDEKNKKTNAKANFSIYPITYRLITKLKLFSLCKPEARVA